MKTMINKCYKLVLGLLEIKLQIELNKKEND